MTSCGILMVTSLLMSLGLSSRPDIVLEVDDGSGLKALSSKALPYGNYMKVHCYLDERPNGISRYYDEKWNESAHKSMRLLKKRNPLANPELLNTTSSRALWWTVRNATFDFSGIYECVCGSFSKVLMVQIYKITDLRSIVVPTTEFVDNVANFQLIRRQIDHKAFENKNHLWLSCSFMVSSEHVLDLLTIHWEGGLFGTTVNHTELNTIYSQSIIRNSSENTIIARLRLNIPIMDSRVYGPYRCVFTFHKSESAVGVVDLKIAPIIKLAYDPPPIPPTNFSYRFMCKDPPCTANVETGNVSDSNAANWTGACELIAAHPPVSDFGLIWAWNEPQWAPYAIRRVSEVGKATYLSEVSSGEAVAEKEVTSPWQVLEQRRRRRKRDVTEVEEFHSGFSGDRPPFPVVFWCWTKNSLGQTAIWWPGPVPYVSGFWQSVWWPILGVALELTSLCIVFGFFRYCHRKRQLRTYVHAPGDEQVSFGLSRLLDSDDSRYSTPQQSSGVNAASEVKHMGLTQSVPYVRLSELHSHMEPEQLGHIGPGYSANDVSVDEPADPQPRPTEHELKTPVVSGQETDEYFWDLDGAPATGERN